MSFDALTIAGLLSAALSGVFLIVTAALQSQIGSVPREHTSGR
jgi:hypothetical protein